MTSTRSTPAPHDGAADIALVGGNVLTLEDPTSRARTVAITGDRIVGVGDDRDVTALIGPRTRVVDLEGRTVLPGLIDQHLHLDHMATACSGRILDLSERVATLAELAERVATHAAQRPDDPWIRGGNWSEGSIGEIASGGRQASRTELDAALPDRPVLLQHFSIHAALVNAAALREAGIDATTPDPVGGRIERDPVSGEPTGLLIESAVHLVEQRIPGPGQAERVAELRHAMVALNRLGVTSVTDPMVTPQGLRDYAALRRGGAPTVRVHALLHWGEAVGSSSSATIERALATNGTTTGFGDDWLAVLGGKLFADGVPSQRTAWLGTAYADADTRGGLVLAGADDDERVAELHRCIAMLHRHRLAVQVHAIGDAAADAVLEGFARAQRDDPWPDARHVLIHGVLLRDEAIERLAALDVSVATNALIRYHASPAMRPPLGDDRWAAGVAVRRMLDAGVRVSDGSDAPVVESDWRLALQALVTRETVESDGAAVGPGEAITAFEALRAWTTEPAYQQHADADKGTIAVGKLADLAIVDRDPLTVPAAELHALEPLATIVGGRVVYDRDGLLA
ncbi:MAG: amidohydrolase [Patulibacter sp.]